MTMDKTPTPTFADLVKMIRAVKEAPEDSTEVETALEILTTDLAFVEHACKLIPDQVLEQLSVNCDPLW